ncbi:MAG: hypothetical protein WCP35_14695 [Verrucomicrobiota bacterium]
MKNRFIEEYIPLVRFANWIRGEFFGLAGSQGLRRREFPAITGAAHTLATNSPHHHYDRPSRF